MTGCGLQASAGNPVMRGRIWGQLPLAVLIILALTVCGWSTPVNPAEPARSDPVGFSRVDSGPLDFAACVRLALRQSPYLTKSAVEIDIRRLAETDSKADFLPSVNFRTRYYVSDLSRTGYNPSPYSLEFVSEPYSPLEAYFSLQVRKLFTKLAVLNHLQAIAEGLQRLGRAFLELAAQQQLARNHADYLAAAERYLLYVQTRRNLGRADQLELKIAAQEVAVARQQQRQTEAAEKQYLASIKAYLDWPAHQELHLDLAAARTQVLGDWEAGWSRPEAPAAATLPLQLQEVKKDLQRYNITLARTKLLPTLFAGVQTPDPLSTVQTRSLFFFVGASLPVWDGGKRLRNVSRQKAILSQQEAERRELELDWQESWREAQTQAAAAADRLNLSHAHLELAELKRRQQELRFRQLGEDFTALSESDKALAAAKKDVIVNILAFDLARLQLCHLANDLVQRYVTLTEAAVSPRPKGREP